MNYKKLNRRAMLKGLGTVAIGLPFLEEMMVSSASAAVKKASIARSVPTRSFNVFLD